MKFNAVQKEEDRRLVTESQSSARRGMRDGAWLLVAMTTLQGCWMFREAGSSIARDPSRGSVSQQTLSSAVDDSGDRVRTSWGDFKLRSNTRQQVNSISELTAVAYFSLQFYVYSSSFKSF
jgi:hypothetical protein